MSLFKLLLPYFTRGKDGPQIGKSEDMNRIVRRVNALSLLRVRRGSSDAFFLGDDEAVLQIKRSGGDAGSSIGTERFRLKSVQANYLTCRPWDGATELAIDVLIAKPYQLREALPSPRTEAGTAYTLTYTTGIDSNNRKRIKTAGSLAETQLVAPVWVVNDEIYSIESDTGVVDGSGKPITRLMVCEARQWTTIS
jgi:hypothetical protein